MYHTNIIFHISIPGLFVYLYEFVAIMGREHMCDITLVIIYVLNRFFSSLKVGSCVILTSEIYDGTVWNFDNKISQHSYV